MECCLTCSETLTFGGAAIGFLGALLLAVSIDPALASARDHLIAIDATLEAYFLSGGNVPVFGGFDKQHARAFLRSGRRVRIGVALLALGFALQAAALLV